MGVDADELVGYGIVLEGSLFEYEDCSNENNPFCWKEGSLNYDYSKAKEKGYHIVIEPYSGSWTYLGIDFLDKDVDKTIENLKYVKVQWNNLITDLLKVIPEEEKELREKISKEKPQIIEMAFYS